MQQDAGQMHEQRVSGRIRCSTLRQENSVQIRRSLATAAASGALIMSGLGLALAAPASAGAPSSAPPTPVPTTSQSARPSQLPTVAPSPAQTSAPVIQVPAGNAGPPSTGSGRATELEIAALLGAGVVLAGGGAVMAVRRRS
jgi:hypothetical protein